MAQSSALLFGARLGYLCRRSWQQLTQWHRSLILKVRATGLPVWLGWLPSATLAISVITLLAFGLVAIAAIVLLLLVSSALIAAVSALSTHSNLDFSEADDDTQTNGYRSGIQGYGHYISGIRVDEDNH